MGNQTTHTPLRRAMFEAGLTNAELARQLGVTDSQVSRWVNGLRPSNENRARIARALKVKKEELW